VARWIKLAMPVFQRLKGLTHDFEVAVNPNNLAALLQARGERDEAEALYRQALSIKENLFGRNHLEVAWTCNNLAMLFREQGRHIQALSLCRRALHTFKKCFRPSHPTRRQCAENYALLQRETA